jgi:single-strand DNA-binding protein
MNDSLITFSGNLGGPVDLVELRDDITVATVRVGSTPRRLRDGRWEDAETIWYTVKGWRQMAVNMADSLHTGDPVIITGRMSAESWTREDGTIVTRQVVVAVAIGHDLARGVSTFSRAGRARSVDGHEAQEQETARAEVEVPVEVPV